MVVLVVDDDPFFRSTAKTMLQSHGFQTVEAGDGIEGYSIIQEMGSSIDLLLADINMPRMDGLSLAQAATEMYPAMPVLLMTGAAPWLPIKGYVVLNKPVPHQELIEAVRKLTGAAGIEGALDAPWPNDPDPHQLCCPCPTQALPRRLPSNGFAYDST